MEIISRKEAREQGLEFYFTGESCIRGHYSKRSVNNGNCLECRVAYRKENSDKIRKQKKEYRIKNKEKRKKYEENNKEKIKQASREYYQKNKARLKEKQRIYYINNRDKVLEYQSWYYQENQDKIKEYSKEYHNRRIKEDATYRTSFFISGTFKRISRQAKYFEKSKNKMSDFDYTPQQLREHLESQFLEGMSWDNHGEWHIDHKVPIIQYVKAGIENPKIINSLDNLIPMWAEHNLSKNRRNLAEWLYLMGEDSEEWKLYSHFL